MSQRIIRENDTLNTRENLSPVIGKESPNVSNEKKDSSSSTLRERRPVQQKEKGKEKEKEKEPIKETSKTKEDTSSKTKEKSNESKDDVNQAKKSTPKKTTRVRPVGNPITRFLKLSDEDLVKYLKRTFLVVFLLSVAMFFIWNPISKKEPQTVLGSVKPQLSKYWDAIKRNGKEKKEEVGEFVDAGLSSAKDRLMETKDTASEKLSEAKEYLGEKVSGATEFVGEKLSDAKDYLGDKFSDAKDFTGDKYSDAKEYLGEKLSEGSETAKDKLNDAKDTIQDKLNDAKKKMPQTSWESFKEDVKDVAQDMRDGSVKMFGTAKDKLSDATEFIGEKVSGAKEFVGEKLSDAKETIVDSKDTAKDKLNSAKNNIKNRVNDAKETVEDKYNDAKSNIKNRMNDAKDTIQDKYNDAKDTIIDGKETAKDRLNSAKSNIKNRVNDAKDTIQDKYNDAKDTVQDKYNEMKDKMPQNGWESFKEDVKYVVGGVEEGGAKMFDVAKDKLSDATEFLGEKVHVAKDILGEKVAEASEIIGEKLSVAKDGFMETKDIASERLAEAREFIQEKIEEEKMKNSRPSRTNTRDINRDGNQYYRETSQKDVLKEEAFPYRSPSFINKDDPNYKTDSELKDEFRGRTRDMKRQANNIMDTASEKLSDAKEYVGEKVNDAKEFVGEKLSDAKKNIIDTKDTAKDKLNDAKDNIQNKFNDAKNKVNPPKSWENFKDDMKNVAQDLKDGGSKMYDNAKDKLSDAKEFVGDKLSKDNEEGILELNDWETSTRKQTIFDNYEKISESKPRVHGHPVKPKDFVEPIPFVGQSNDETLEKLADKTSADIVLKEPFTSKTYAKFSLKKIFVNVFSFALGRKEIWNYPINAISDNMVQGHCYSFEGQKGNITIDLKQLVNVRAVTIEHPQTVHLESSPKRFNVFAFNAQTIDQLYRFRNSGVEIGRDFIFPKGTSGPKVFNVEPREARFLQFRFLENNGDPEYSCIYRINVIAEK